MKQKQNRMSLHKKFTKCAKLVDEKKNQLFCCLSVRDFELKILFKGVHLTNSEKNLFNRKVYCLSNISKISICHHTMFNSVLNMRKIYSLSHLIIKPLS